MIARVTPREKPVLAVLCTRCGDFAFMTFATIMADASLGRSEVRRACRALAQKGLAEYARGMWTEDGTPAGSGYAATQAGRDILVSMTAPTAEAGA